MVEIAAKVGVRRFIPCEWGGDLLIPANASFPVLRNKGEARDLLYKRAEDSQLTYTLFFTGIFLDWALRSNLFFDIKNKKAKLYDGGKNIISVTTLKTIGEGVAATLAKPEETANKAIYLQDTTTTAEKLLAIVKKYTPGSDWDVEVIDTDEAVKIADEGLAAGQPIFPLSLNHIAATIFGGPKYGMPWEDKNSMPLLGLKEMTEEELDNVVKLAVEAVTSGAD